MSELKKAAVKECTTNNNAPQLEKFRDEWKAELNRNAGTSAESRDALQAVKNPKNDEGTQHKVGNFESPPADESPYPFQYTDNLMKSWQDPSPHNLSFEKRQYEDVTRNDLKPVKKQRRSMVDEFLDDLNDINEVPFFDVNLPREIALRIFSHLGINDLCSCAQVSKAWQFLAEDCVIWEKCYWKMVTNSLEEISNSKGGTWKEKVRSLMMKRKNLQSNWKEHKCESKHYSFARGGVMTSADYHNHILVAGYSSGKIKSWNILTEESQSHDCADEALVIADEDYIAASQNTVTCVRAAQFGIVAGYNHGDIQVWSHDEAEQMLLINFPSYRILSIDIQSSLLYAVLVHRASYQCEIKIISVNHSSLTVLDTLVVRGSEQKYSLPKPVLSTIPSSVSNDGTSIAYLLQDSLNIHGFSDDMRNINQLNTLNSSIEEFVATSFSCLNCTHAYIHLGMTCNLGLHAEYKVRCYDVQQTISIYDLRGHTSHVTCVDNSLTNMNIICTGCHDRRVRLYDTRLPGFSPVHTFMGHHGAVECIQCDDNKIVSGDNEGYVCVWDQRTTSKFWESKNTHPVKLLKFTHEYLISANIPTDMPELDDDGIAHLRMRGRLQVSDFSTTQDSLNISIS